MSKSEPVFHPFSTVLRLYQNGSTEVSEPFPLPGQIHELRAHSPQQQLLQDLNRYLYIEADNLVVYDGPLWPIFAGYVLPVTVPVQVGAALKVVLKPGPDSDTLGSGWQFRLDVFVGFALMITPVQVNRPGT
jgi:hypothetical protein